MTARRQRPSCSTVWTRVAGPQLRPSTTRGLSNSHKIAGPAAKHLWSERPSPGGRAVNVHFADGYEGGGLTFDSRMKPGVVRHTNGVPLMRAVGIDVPATATAPGEQSQPAASEDDTFGDPKRPRSR